MASSPAERFVVDDGGGARAAASRGLHPALYIATWILFSNMTILFNKWILDTAGFRYPILLTCWHLAFSTIATQLLARTTTLLDSRHKLPITPHLYLRTICPIGLFYSGSLVCSNLVYLYLSVAFIQMLKSAAPVAVLFASWAWRVANPNLADLANICVIVAGVALASVGEIHFSLIGFIFQLGGILFEAIRIVMIQVMLSGEGLRMEPLVGLYYYSPVCAVMNLVVAIVAEIPRFQWHHVTDVGISLLFLNALIAFLLNIASVFLIGKTSGLVMTLTGIFKNILLIVVSILIWRTPISLVQAIGYAIALAGLVYYSVGYNQLAAAAHTTAAFIAASLGPSSSSTSSAQASSALLARRLFVVAIAAFAALFILVMALRHYDPRAKAFFSLPALFGTER